MLAGVLQSAIVLALVVPFAIAAFASSKEVREVRWLAILPALFVATTCVGRLHVWRWGGWNWGGKLAVLVVLAAFLALARRPPRELGLPAPVKGSWPAALAAIGVALVLPIVGVAAGWRSKTDLATWLFQPTLPGLTEELEVRGIEQGLLDRTFGRPWRLFGVQMGWGAVLPQLAWSFLHAVRVAPDLHMRLELVNMLPPFVGGWILAWMRERTASVWPCVAAHGIANELVVAATALRQAM